MMLSSFFILVGIVSVAFALTYFQYLYKAKNKTNTVMLLALLRFIGVFALLLLLWNPLITSTKYETQKTPLPILLDNSSSIQELKSAEVATNLLAQFKNSTALNEKFAVQYLAVDSACYPLDKFDFNGSQSRLDQAGAQLKLLYRNQQFPAIYLTDGNQTAGTDFEYSFGAENPVYPIVLGDTLPYFDVKIDRVNVNNYAFYQNKFPVEIHLSYTGAQSCSVQLKINQGNTTVYTDRVALNAQKKSAVVSALLPANRLGNQLYQVILGSAQNEKNTANNAKKFVVDVLDQRRRIALVSVINHPDISAFKRAIEHNGQSKVSVVKPNDLTNLSDYDVLLMYQPTARFLSVYQLAKKSKTPLWVITGKQTDFAFLNQMQPDLSFKMSTQAEEYLPAFDSQFSLFALDDLGFSEFPPLQNPFGTVTASPNTATILSAKIQGVDTKQPLLALANSSMRTVYLLGENIWKWRLHYHTQQNSFEKFDVFVDKIVQYLASTESKKSLVVDYQHFYSAGDELEISAQYFTKNYEFDDQARLQLQVINQKTKAKKVLELLKSTNYFKANLAGLAAGKYAFTVKELRSNSSFTGNFEVLDFEIEKQFVNPNTDKLAQLALLTKGKVVYPNQANQLINQLLNDPKYQLIQKEVVKKTPLLDWVFLLVFVLLVFGTEWFIRKYNGLL